MNKHPVTNTGTTNMHVAGAVIRPGETRMVDTHLVPPALQPKAAKAAPAPPPDLIAELAKTKGEDVVAKLPELSDEQLTALEQAEQEKGDKARKGVLAAITADRLRRAADQ